MSLKLLDIEETYRSDQGNIVDQFYLPVLSECKEYWRAVGYFSSSSLAIAAKGVTALIKNNGRMRLIASPQLDEDDIQALRRGYMDREEVIKKSIIKNLNNLEDALIKKRMECLAWLVAENKLDIRFALMKENQGIYHEKMGILIDSDNNKVAFNGSANETYGGIYLNFESVDVFCSWKAAEKNRVLSKLKYFDNLWNNRTNKLDVIEFSEASKREIFNKYSTTRKPLYDPESEINKNITKDDGHIYSNHKEIEVPRHISIRPYQNEAIRKWFENNGMGVWKMATGTGKTFTALCAATLLRKHISEENKKKSISIIVVCPYKHLVTQWAENAQEFNYSPLKCYENKRMWNERLSSAITSVNAGVKNDLFIITTNSTFSGDEFHRILKSIKKDVLIIVDEAHNLGSVKLRNKLPHKARYRLGLSATPERWFDEIGTQELYDYFGKPVYEYGLKEAIENGFLTQYDYYPILVPLTENEIEQYLDISQKITKMYALGHKDLDNENSPLNNLLIKRARLISSAENKLVYLEKAIKNNGIQNTFHNLIYCGDGRVDEETGEEEIRQIEAVTRLLGNKLGIKNSSYVADVKTEKREILLKNFVDGEIQALVAIRCLDEGVDVPSTKRAFILASSSNPRQFIQRRGRVLRRAPGKKIAEIWDFIVIPPYNSLASPSFNTERKLIKKELQRVIEFTKLARNGPQADNSLLEIKKQYNLLDI